MGPKIFVKSLGRIDNKFISYVVSVLKNFYKEVLALGFKLPLVIDLIIYEDKQKALMFLEREALINSISTINLYPIMHEAWSGLPRIHIIYNELKHLSNSVIRSLILHEAAHSILHGSPKYYLITLDKDIAQKVKSENLLALATLAAALVKDMDVLDLLKSLGFTREINLYIKFIKEEELNDIKCNNLYSILNFAKLLLPFQSLEELNDIIEKIDKNCINILPQTLSILKEIHYAKEDYEKKVNNLIRKFLNLTEPFIHNQ